MKLALLANSTDPVEQARFLAVLLQTVPPVGRRKVSLQPLLSEVLAAAGDALTPSEAAKVIAAYRRRSQ